MKQLNNFKVICEFCSEKTNFATSKQVTLKIDKSNAFQNLFAIMCSKCDESGKKKTVNGQLVKVINNINKLKNEESLFDTEEGE